MLIILLFVKFDLEHVSIFFLRVFFFSTYLTLDLKVKYLVCAVKLWMKLNNFADRHLFTTYAQIWMVLFFLMQPEIAVVPPVLKLRHMLPNEQQQFNIEG